MKPGADLSPPGLAKLIADFVAALELDDVTLIGNDTGGALCQLVVTRHPQRIGRLVLTPCDAYENFLPPAFRYLQGLARVPGGVSLIANSMRIPASRRSPLAFGWLAKRPIPAEVLAAWTAPIIRDKAIRRDARAVLRGISKRYTLEAAARLRDFAGPTMLAWATEDRFFKPRFAERSPATSPARDSSIEVAHVRLRGPAGAAGGPDPRVRRRLSAGAGPLVAGLRLGHRAQSPGRSGELDRAAGEHPQHARHVIADPSLGDLDLDLDRPGVARQHLGRAERREHVVHLVVAGEKQSRELLIPSARARSASS